MSDPGRNDPCPCGSGKKYKRCCLERERGEERSSGGRDLSVSRAVRWLHQHHGEAVEEAVRAEFFGALSSEEKQRLARLPQDVSAMLETNLNEWLLAEGGVEIDGRRQRFVDLVLGPGGPLLDAEARLWLEALSREPLALWELQDVRPGVGFTAIGVLTDTPAPCWVVERSGSRQLDRWSLLGARLIPHGDHWLMSGAAYLFRREELSALREEHRRAHEFLRDHGASAAAKQRAEGQVIRALWLGQLVAPVVLPDLRDAATGEPLLFVTDHYRVRDWKQLEEILARQSDVEGDRKEGWTRFEEIDDERRRALLHLNLGRGDRLEAVARTLGAGDRGRTWFQGLARECVEHVTRELSDPKALAEEARAHPERPRPAQAPMTTELMQTVYRSVYADWADKPVPNLGGKTPREASRTAAGRQKVVELLKLYETGEHQQARQQGREPASLEFLWQEVGLSRPE